MRPTYANVVSTLALAIAVAGGGTAVAKGIAKNSVGTAQLRKGAVTAAKIKTGTIGGKQIKNSSLGGIDIANGSLGGIDIARGSLGGKQIADGSLGGVDIADGSLGGQDIAPGSLSGSQIADNSLTSADIADGTISSNDIANGTISGSDIGKGALGFDLLSSDAVKQINQRWTTDTVSGGSVLSGFGILSFDAASIGATHTIAVGFPAVASDVPTAEPIGSAACTGRFDSPSAPTGTAHGALCVYLDSASTNVTVADPVSSDSKRGFLLTQTAPAVGESSVQFTWAYTAS